MADPSRLAQQSAQGLPRPNNEPMKPQAPSGYFPSPPNLMGRESSNPPPLASNGQYSVGKPFYNEAQALDTAKPYGYGQPPPMQGSTNMGTQFGGARFDHQFQNVAQQPTGHGAAAAPTGGSANNAYRQPGGPPSVGPANYGSASRAMHGAPLGQPLQSTNPAGQQPQMLVNGPGNSMPGPNGSKPITNGEIHKQSLQQPPAFQQNIRHQGNPYPRPPIVTGEPPQFPGPSSANAVRPQNTDWKRQPPNSLPVPYQFLSSQSSAPSTTAFTPSPATSEPPSAKSSRNPSPISTQRFDALEGQFTPTFNNSGANNMSAPMRQARPPGPPTTNQAMMPSGPMPQTSGPDSNSRLPFPSQPVPPAASYPQPQRNNYPLLQQGNSFQQPAPESSFPRPPLGTSHSQPQGHSFPQPQGSSIPPPPRTSFPQASSYPTPQGNSYLQPPPPPPTTVQQQAALTSSDWQQQQPSTFPPRPPVLTSGPAPDQQMFPPMTGAFQMPPPLQTQPGPPMEQPRWPTTQPSHPEQRIPGGPPVSGSNNQQPNYSADRMGMQMRSLNIQNIEPIDLLCNRNILPSTPVEAPKVVLPLLDPKTANCSQDIFRCTLTRIPESQSVLQKCRLPLGIIIHPFKDLGTLPVVQCTVIVRCRSCRAYINPFVQFLDQRRWKCNLCFRVNELQEEFMFDPMTKTYGDPTRRPEIKSATIEFIAPSEYMLRPPQPAVYLFVLDVSYAAVETGYLRCFCETLLDKLENLPGDSRTRVGFMTFDNAIQFYNLAEGLSQPQMMVVSDIEDVFLPCPDNLLVNLHENMELVKDLLMQLPIQFMESRSPDSALGAALQAAKKLVAPTGGRITVMQVSLPNIGPGALKSREDPNLRAGKEVPNLGPANDFYKKLSLDCSGNQVAVDLFLLSSQYCDIATLSCISKYSGGNVHFYSGFHATTNAGLAEKFEQDLKRYFTRKIGFEAVMRIRCTKGLSIHTFHGNFFVRSTDLLSLPNINPDAGFGMQMSIEESLSDCTNACFQAALLYTSSKGERRIRVHTMCLPVTANVLDVINGGDQQAIACLLTKMAVDRSLTSSMPDARDALLNACVDAVTAYKLQQGGTHVGVVVPYTLRLLPLYILAIMKHMAFRLGTSTKLDDRVYAMSQMKTLPLSYLMNYLYPSMYPIHTMDHSNYVLEDDKPVVLPPLLNLTAEKFERQGVFLLDSGEKMFLYVCHGVNPQFCVNVLNVRSFDEIPEKMNELPELETPESERLRSFVSYLQSQRPFHAVFQVLRNTSKNKHEFLQHLIEDRTESTYSYYEFLKHIQQLMTK